MNDESKNKKVLVIEEIEDDASLRKVIHDKLALEGFSVLEANDGESGLVIALREHPDLILLDIIMPKMDGLTMMKKLRETNEWGKNVPIILLTNLSADNDKIMKAITDNEPAYYLVKSNWTINDLVTRIRERLSRV
ncbi:MAG: response regulator [Candidatus Paceibacterota bacterium]|jgi:DNA-binding response OmpR family regulator